MGYLKCIFWLKSILAFKYFGIQEIPYKKVSLRFEFGLSRSDMRAIKAEIELRYLRNGHCK